MLFRSHFYSDKELKVGAAQVKLAGVTFTQGEEFSIIRELETKDLEENLRWIRDAKRQADYTLASIHSHEAGAKNLLTAEKKGDLADPAEINRNFSLAAIDNGGYFEGDVSKNNLFRDELVSTPYTVDKNGCVLPLEAPGLGVEVDENFLIKHPVIEGPSYV